MVLLTGGSCGCSSNTSSLLVITNRKKRTVSELNQRPIDLQSIALPLS